MKHYKNKSGNSGIYGYEYGADWIRIEFCDGAIYEYNSCSAGLENISKMKSLADSGENLNSFINNQVYMRYSRKYHTGVCNVPINKVINPVTDAIEFFEPLYDKSRKWMFSKAIYVLECLDENYDFNGYDTEPLKHILVVHAPQILAELSTLPFIIDSREEGKIDRSRFWWYIDELVFDYFQKWLQNINHYFRFGELFSDFNKLDEYAYIFNDTHLKELKTIMESKREFILHCDKSLMKDFRENENISPRNFWWWL